MKDLLRIILAYASRALLTPCLPFLRIRRNRVLFQSYREKQYSCSPRYISEELIRIAGGRLEIAWSFREPERFRFLEAQGIRVLKAGSAEAIKYALTAQVICVNTYYKPTLPRRKGQLQLRTWHGGGAYKKVAGAEKLPFLRRQYIKMQLEGANLYLTSSSAFTKQTIRGSFGYKGEVLSTGLPRNDILINRADPAPVRKRLGLAEDERLVLYAPTYRYDEVRQDFRLDAAKLTSALEKRFGGCWVYAFRGHVFTKGSPASGTKDLTGYPEMQELLLCADALVTDYSSSMWDMSLTGKPVFLYCTDLSSYTAERDFYTDIHTWPFPLAEDNAQLEKNILGFDASAYADAVKKHHAELGSCESGHASATAAQIILAKCVE